MKNVLFLVVLFAAVFVVASAISAEDPPSPFCSVGINVEREGTVFQSDGVFKWQAIWDNACNCEDAESVVKLLVSASRTGEAPWTVIDQYNLTPGGMDDGYPSKTTFAGTNIPLWADFAKLSGYILCSHSPALPLNDRDPDTGWKEVIYEKE